MESNPKATFPKMKIDLTAEHADIQKDMREIAALLPDPSVLDSFTTNLEKYMSELIEIIDQAIQMVDIVEDAKKVTSISVVRDRHLSLALSFKDNLRNMAKKALRTGIIA